VLQSIGEKRVRRGFALLIGLGIASAAGYALVTGTRSPPEGERGDVGSTPVEVHGVSQPHGEIDTETQDQLREILRAADREDHE
jgi:hypothetical protein